VLRLALILFVVVFTVALASCAEYSGPLAPISSSRILDSETAPNSTKIVVKPKSLLFASIGSSQHVTVTERGYTGKFKGAGTCRGIAGIFPTSGTGPTFKLKVTSKHSGKCSETFVDARKNEGRLYVTVALPPSPSPSPSPTSTPRPTLSPSPTPSPTPTPALSPYYTGTEVIGGFSGPLAVSVNQNGTSLNGTFGNGFSNGNNVGTLSGTRSGDNFTATLTSIVVQGSTTLFCGTTLNGTASAQTLSGSLTLGSPCTATGTFTLSASAAPPLYAANAAGLGDDSGIGAFSITATLSQNGVTVTGPYTENNGFTSYSGQLYGVAIGSSVYFDLVPQGYCPLAASGAPSGSYALVGTYAAFDCSGTETGSFKFSTF